MPDRKNERPAPRATGLRNFDPETFKYEVADEIRAGLREDKQKAQAAGLDPSKPFDKQVQQTQGNKSEN